MEAEQPKPTQQGQQRRKLNVVVISDTHGSYSKLNKFLSMSGDIFIHAGDFTEYGKEEDFIRFFKYLQRLNFRYKVVIAGNHEIMLDNGCISHKKKETYLYRHKCNMSKEQIVHELKKRCIYLQHQAVQIEGVRIFGSPYSPYFVGNAFQYRPQHEKVIWDAVPQKVDLLVTHCPPFGILDKNNHAKPAGSEYLRKITFNRKPKYHIFGHIHQSSGLYKQEGITFLNVANDPTCLKI